MMTFKEINEKVLHYEEELKYGSKIISDLTNLISNQSDEKTIEYLYIEKMKVEFFCFVTASYIDMLCVYRNIKRSKSEWEKFYNLKITYLIAYETINTYHKYKREINKIVTKEEKEFYKAFFDMLNRELYDFKYDFDYDNIMPRIRNKSTAHYDKNFLEYYSTFELIERYKKKDIVRSFLNFLNPLHYFTYALINDEIDPLLYINSWLS